MLEIHNISSYRVSVMTGGSGGSNRPNVINLGPGERQMMMKAELHAWTLSSKQDLSRYVQMSTLQIKELDSVHVGRDMAVAPVYTALTLESAIDTAISFRDAWNLHLKSGVHIAEDTTNVMTFSNPETLPVLAAFISSQQVKYTAHIPSVVFHAKTDIINVLTPIVPGTLATCIAALKELFAKFEKHKRQVAGTVAPPLTPATILTY